MPFLASRPGSQAAGCARGGWTRGYRTPFDAPWVSGGACTSFFTHTHVDSWDACSVKRFWRKVQSAMCRGGKGPSVCVCWWCGHRTIWMLLWHAPHKICWGLLEPPLLDLCLFSWGVPPHTEILSTTIMQMISMSSFCQSHQGTCHCWCPQQYVSGGYWTLQQSWNVT